MDQDLARLRSCFDELIQTGPADRPARLDALCGSDTVLRRRLEGMLAAAEADDRFLSSPTRSRLESPAHASVPSERPGTQIGPYKLLQQIGEGGFGVVFMAEQDRPVRRRVALKIIKLGMDTRQVVARFEQERQALALMDHPHIARVLDAGATESGRPYFVMEYVTGDPITEFADARRLSVADRLELFSQVCQAVQHAHTKGVIHRDLKPRNVLASMSDGRPFARVIDFGIAKATGARLTEKTLFTEHRQLIGTPEYMSPEQAEGSPDIDTRTDVYSLGVMLYELLTGATPFDGARLRSAAWGELQRIIREEEPPAPSVRLSRDGRASGSTARTAEPGRLGALVRGELDWIVMKALEKDRARRYESPGQLAADVQRHLAGEAVVAAPASAAYRLRKFARRNKGPVLAGGLVTLSLLAGIAGTTWQWRRAAQFLAEAEHQAHSAGRAAAEANLAKQRAEVQLGFAARTGRAVVGILQGEPADDDVRFVESLADEPEPDSDSGPYDPDHAERNVGKDLKALSSLAIDSARQAVQARLTMAARVADLASDDEAVAPDAIRAALITQIDLLGPASPQAALTLSRFPSFCYRFAFIPDASDLPRAVQVAEAVWAEESSSDSDRARAAAGVAAAAADAGDFRTAALWWARFDALPQLARAQVPQYFSVWLNEPHGNRNGAASERELSAEVTEAFRAYLASWSAQLRQAPPARTEFLDACVAWLEGIECYRDALRVEIAAVRFRRGQFTEAARLLASRDPAQAERPGEPALLAMCQFKLGDRAAAQVSLERARHIATRREIDPIDASMLAEAAQLNEKPPAPR